jgi:tRNA threonylcarbamoyladenosine biosynthesis protein TsaB
LILAFDTATEVATSALVRDGEVLGERASRPVRLLADVDELLRAASLAPGDVEALAVGLGPGSFTGVRMGLATARGLGLALGIPAAGVSTLDALAVGSPGAVPVVDAKRREVFVGGDEARVCDPADVHVEPGTVCVGDGALRYRAVLEAAGAVVPPDASAVHVPWARFHAQLARAFAPAAALEPIYLRVPDAERTAPA